MNFSINKILPYEIIHFAENGRTIASKGNTVYELDADYKVIHNISLPETFIFKILSVVRLARRSLRIDKCNVVVTADNNFVIIRKGKVYFYNRVEKKLTETLTLKNCRNVLHQSVNASPEGFLYFGEYGHNGERNEVPVYRSIDNGRTWEVIYLFKPKEIKHIHGCYYDKYEDKIWVCTGDFENENWLIVADKDFKTIEKIGNGQQIYRTCNLFFEAEYVHWLMDSQLEDSYHVRLNRKTRTIERLEKFQGPIWYSKKLNDKLYVAGTTQEIGEGVLDKYAHLMASTDLVTWHSIKKFEHDGLPKRYFKFGVIGFADGEQSAERFFIHAEALKGFDGKSMECSIQSTF